MSGLHKRGMAYFSSKNGNQRIQDELLDECVAKIEFRLNYLKGTGDDTAISRCLWSYQKLVYCSIYVFLKGCLAEMPLSLVSASAIIRSLMRAVDARPKPPMIAICTAETFPKVSRSEPREPPPPRRLQLQ